MMWYLINVPIYLISFLVICWIAGAFYFDLRQAKRQGAVLAVVWIVIAFSAFLFWQPAWQPFLALLAIFGLVAQWWFRQKPSQDRAWQPDFSKLARVELNGDWITIENVRNTQILSENEKQTRYETRKYRLSNLQGLDAMILFWGSKAMSHPMFVFDFGEDGRFCVSIGVRYRIGQAYSFFRSIYRQQEIIYVVSDERDAILRRTLYNDINELYLYRLNTNDLGTRQFFFEYANQINDLAAHPRWYNGVTTNCTTSIYQQGRGRIHWDWRILFNGRLDEMMYDNELLDQRLSFAELKRLSRVNEIANETPADGFGDLMREKLPGYHLETDSSDSGSHDRLAIGSAAQNSKNQS